MLVVFKKENADVLKDKMTVLELDTFMQEGLPEPVTAYAIIEIADVSLEEIPQLENLTKIHNTMMNEYRAKRFSYCEQAMEHLRGKWKGSLDSFYDHFNSRIQQLKQADLAENWTGVIYNNACSDCSTDSK